MALAERYTAEIRATVYYFTFFMAAGAGVTYASIWMLEKGISESQIGIINAVPVLLLLGINLIVGRVADKAEDWRSVIVIGSLLAGAVPIGLFFVNDFWGCCCSGRWHRFRSAPSDRSPTLQRCG